jgi:HEAT repeat protein
LIEALKRPEALSLSTSLIGQLGDKAAAAVPALSAALSDPNPEARREVLLAFAGIGAEASSAQAVVLKALNDPEPRVRHAAAYAVGRMGERAKGAAPQLRAELESSDPVLRVASAWALVHVSARPDQVASVVLPILIHGLRNENSAVRRGSAEALGRLGKAGLGAEAALKSAARDPDESVRKNALEALEKMGAVLDAPVPATKRPLREK